MIFIVKKYLNDYTDDSIAVILRAKPEACPERSEGTEILPFASLRAKGSLARNDNEGKPCFMNLKYLKIIFQG